MAKCSLYKWAIKYSDIWLRKNVAQCHTNMREYFKDKEKQHAAEFQGEWD